MPSKSFDIQFEIRNADVVAAAISQLPGTVRQVAGNKISLLAEHVKNAVRDATPKDSGKLAQSTQLQKKTNLKYQIIQTATAPKRSISGYFYGRGVRHGAKAPTGGTGVIKPKGDYPLYKSGTFGPVAIVRHHPGIQGDDAITPYVDTAVEKSQNKIDATKKEIAAEVTQKAARGFKTGKVNI